MPTFAFPGEITPGQLGPISREGRFFILWLTFTISAAGMPSVMQMTKSNPASAASMMATAAKAGGTKITDVLQFVSALALATESKTGTSSASWPPFQE